MVVASDTGQVADLVFVVEGTANMGAYLGELKANYIVPTLECFNGGPAEDRECGSELTSTLYALIVFMAADAAPEPSVSCGSAPTTSINKFLSWLDRVPFLGGAAEGCSHIVEGLGTALQAFDDFQNLREPHLTTQKHCILICNSPPYPLPCYESMSYAGLGADQLASLMGERGINLSIISPRKIPALFKLYDKAGGDLQLAQNKNYTKDRRHLVLLKGYQLQERPLSPASAELKDKPQLTTAPLLGSVLPTDKPLLAPNTLAPAGSPGSNNLMQSQPKGSGPGTQLGKKRPPGGSPPNQPPFKQMVSMQQGNLQGQVGHGQQQALNQQQQQQQQQSLQGPASLMSPQQQPLASAQPPMSAAPPIPASLSQMHMVGPPLKQNQQARNIGNLALSGIGMPRGGPISASQTAPSFMNQPNPPNVTISKGSPMPMMSSQPMDTSMGRPIRDQAPMNPTSMAGSRMLWNTAQMGPRAPGAPGGLPPSQNMGSSSPVSQLVMQLQQQPGRANPGMLSGPRLPGNDMMGGGIRPPNVTAGAPGPPNASGPANVLSMMQSGNIGPGGPNQSAGMQQNVNQGQQKNLAGQMPMGHSVMNNPPSALQNQLGAQGQRFVLLQSMSGNQPPLGNANMAPSGQQQPNVNILNSLGNIGQSSLPGSMNQPNSMGPVTGQGPLSQPQPVSQPQNQTQPPHPGQQPQPQAQKERRVVWQGVVEWQEKPKMANEPTGKINRQVQCQVSSSLNAIGEPEVNADKWPKKLIMQLIPKLLMQHFGSAFLKMARNVIFHFNNNMETAEALGNLNKVMSNGFIGCVHFSPHQNANCDIRILMLIYSNDKHTYVGFIPNDQPGFVAAIRNVITKKQQLVKTQQLQQHMLGPEGGPGPQQLSQISSTMGSGMPINLPGPSPCQGSQQHGVGSGGPPAPNASGAPPSIPPSLSVQGGPPPNSSVGAGGPGIGPIPPGNMQPMQQTGHMGPHGNPGSTPSGPPGPDGGGAAGGMHHGGAGGGATNQAHELQLAAERQQNLIKIQQLQQSLEAAQQKEMQLKAAQDHQKQHLVPHPPLRQQPADLFQQLQQQQQQRLLHVGGNTSSANNPQLRHLLQLRQQQQLLQQQQHPGQRPMAPGQMGPGPGPGQQQNPNPGGNIFGDDIM